MTIDKRKRRKTGHDTGSATLDRAASASRSSDNHRRPIVKKEGPAVVRNHQVADLPRRTKAMIVTVVVVYVLFVFVVMPVAITAAVGNWVHG